MKRKLLKAIAIMMIAAALVGCGQKTEKSAGVQSDSVSETEEKETAKEADEAGDAEVSAPRDIHYINEAGIDSNQVVFRLAEGCTVDGIDEYGLELLLVYNMPEYWLGMEFIPGDGMSNGNHNFVQFTAYDDVELEYPVGEEEYLGMTASAEDFEFDYDYEELKYLSEDKKWAVIGNDVKYLVIFTEPYSEEKSHLDMIELMLVVDEELENNETLLIEKAKTIYDCMEVYFRPAESENPFEVYDIDGNKADISGYSFIEDRVARDAAKYGYYIPEPKDIKEVGVSDLTYYGEWKFVISPIYDELGSIALKETAYGKEVILEEPEDGEDYFVFNVDKDGENGVFLMVWQPDSENPLTPEEGYQFIKENILMSQAQ